ncbi:hypothetical protein TNCV_3113331 [Trichonephila clavipes]|nr:hypothetical protein TNCV_3113331 [Trichonephila clavipes]
MEHFSNKFDHATLRELNTSGITSVRGNLEVLQHVSFVMTNSSIHWFFSPTKNRDFVEFAHSYPEIPMDVIPYSQDQLVYDEENTKLMYEGIVEERKERELLEERKQRDNLELEKLRIEKLRSD